jgi:hypothetical protein
VPLRYDVGGFGGPGASMFVIWWGRKVKRIRVGHVADFCPICHAQKTFTLVHVGMVNHVYSVATGTTDLIGYERICADCATAIPTDITRYSSVAPKPAPLGELKAQTFPSLDTAIRDLRAAQQQAKRPALIKEPFLLLSPKVEQRFAQVQIGPGAGIAIVAAILLIFVGAPRLIESEVLPNAQPEAVFGAFAAVGIALIVWQVIASGSRFIRREVVSRLAKALKPLRPTEQEIDAALAELKMLKQKIGKKVSAPDLLEQIRNAA